MFKPGDVVIRIGKDDNYHGMKKGAEYVVTYVDVISHYMELKNMGGYWALNLFKLKEEAPILEAPAEEWIPKVGDLVTTEYYEGWPYCPEDPGYVSEEAIIQEINTTLKKPIARVADIWWPFSALTRHDGVKPSSATPAQPKKKRRVYNEA